METPAAPFRRSLLAAVMLLVVLAGLCFPNPARAQSLSKPTLLNLKFEQKLNSQLTLDLPFRNEDGAPIHLRDYFGSKPVVLVLGYYECPMLCNLVLNSLVESLQNLHATIGKEFDVVFVSINPRETPPLAAAKKQTYLKRYGRAEAAQGWHFLTGQEPAIKTLADEVGFQFAYDAALQQYAHPSGIVVLTPEGKVSRYFFGLNYPSAGLNQALTAAAAHRVGSPVQALLFLCFQHMPLTGKYSGSIMLAARVVALLAVFTVLGYIVIAVRREIRNRRPAPAAGEGVRQP